MLDPDAELQTTSDLQGRDNTTFTGLVLAPNPASTRTELRFTLLQTGPVSIDVVDEQGRVLRQQKHASLEAGPQQLSLDLNELPPGHYRVQVKSRDALSVQTLVVGQ